VKYCKNWAQLIVSCKVSGVSHWVCKYYSYIHIKQRRSFWNLVKYYGDSSI